MILECHVPELAETAQALAQGLDALDDAAEPTFVIDRGASGELRLLRSGVLVHSTRDKTTLLGALELELDDEAPRLFRGRSVFHAAVVSAREGAILIAGRSRAGKSTLATTLVNLGFDYMTDDAAFVEEDGSVVAYPRRISLRPGARELVGPLGDRFTEIAYQLPDRMPAEYLVPRPSAVELGPTRVRVIAFLERMETGSELRPISGGEALARLLTYRLSSEDPRRDLRRAHRLVASASQRVVIEGGTPMTIALSLLMSLLGVKP